MLPTLKPNSNNIYGNELGPLVKVLGQVYFLFLFLLSVLFYKERMLFADASFFSFKMVEFEDFNVELGRWGTIFSQLLPYLVIKCGGSLKLILLAYSVSYILWYYLIFELIVYWLKDYRAGLVLILFLCLGFRQTFYYSTAELYMGTAFVCFLWSFASSIDWQTASGFKKNSVLIVGVCFIYITSYFHQLLLFAISFLFIFEIIAYKKWKDLHLWIILFLTVIWYYIRLKYLSQSQYEADKIPTAKIFIEYLRKIKSLPGWKYYLEFSIQQMSSLWIALSISCVVLLIKKKFIQVLVILGFTFSFLVINIVEYREGTSSLFFENYYVLVGLFAAVAVLFAFTHLLKPSRLVFLAIIVLIGINLKGIFDSHYRITERLTYVKHLTDYGQKVLGQKFLICTDNLPVELCGDSWSLPFETLLLSSLNSPDSAVTIYHTSNMNSLDSLLNNQNVFFGPKWAVTWFTTNNMSRKFYHLPSTGYMKLSSSQCGGDFKEELYSNKNVNILPLTPEYIAAKDTLLFVPIKILNASPTPIASVTGPCKQVVLSYHVYDTKGNLLIKDGFRTKLGLDVRRSYVQTLQIVNKFKKGEYIIEADFVTEGERWWEINARFKLIVN